MDNQQRNRNHGTLNDCNSSTFNLVMGQSNLYGNIKPHDVDISLIQNALACKPSMTVSGQKSKNVFVMVKHVDNSGKLLMQKPTLSNIYALKASPCKSGYMFNYRKENTSMELYSHIIQNQTDLDTLYQNISNQTTILKPLTKPYTHLMAYLAIDLYDSDKAKLIGNYLINSFKEPCYSLTIEQQAPYTIHLIYDPTYVYHLQEHLQKINL